MLVSYPDVSSPQIVNFGDRRLCTDTWQVIAATNRIDILDPALLRSGRLDRKIEFPLPNESARQNILQIHARKLTHKGVK
jgi:ATP-dependent 26S proteasome regulatory subunit